MRTSMRRDHQFSLFKWVSFKELVFVFGACSVLAVLLHTQDQLEFKSIWNDSFTVSHYRDSEDIVRNQQKLPLPIVTDLNSDGSSDVVLVTPDNVLKVYSVELSPLYLGHHGFRHSTKSVSLSPTSKVVAMATGFLQPYQSMVQVRKQVIVVLYSDWMVTCFSHNLKELWSKKVTEKDNTIIGEATVLVSSVQVKGKLTEGTIYVGGRISRMGQYEYPKSSYQRIRRGEYEQLEQYMLQSLGHYSSYALNAKSGNVIWSHEPGDYEIHPAYDDSISSFMHLKLVLHKYMSHQGEVSWHQYSSAIKDVMPHSWFDDLDSKMDLAHFKKDKKRTNESPVSEHITKVSDLAMDHIVGYAFGGLRPHSSTEHVKNPNVLVIHTMKGLEVLHLHTGRPLFTLPLSPTHSVHGDINGDGIIEHVQAVVNPGNTFQPGDIIHKHDDIECYGQATPFNSGYKSIYRHSICKATHWTESFIATEKWIPKLNTYNRKRVNHGITEPFTPLLIESSSHQHPLKLSSFIHNSSFKYPMGVVYDTVFLLSSGRVTSIGPAGQFNWQVDTLSDWDTVTDVLYNDRGSDHKSKISSESFTPTLAGFSLKPYAKKTHILIVGWDTITVLNSFDGTILVEYPLSHPPISKAVVADFNDDGTNDIVIVTNDRVLGLSLVHRSGFFHSTVLSLFVGFLIVIVAVYTRQRTGFLMPRRKEAVD